MSPMLKGHTVRSLEERFWAKVKKGDGCWEWTGNRAHFGYGQLKKGGRDSGQPAHRISWEIHFGPIPDGMQVLHHCDNPGCVRPDHLFLGTQKDNIRDMHSKGRARGGRPHAVGEPRQRLSDEQVRAIRQCRKEGATLRTIASEYGITIGYASQLCAGKRRRERSVG